MTPERNPSNADTCILCFFVCRDFTVFWFQLCVDECMLVGEFELCFLTCFCIWQCQRHSRTPTRRNNVAATLAMQLAVRQHCRQHFFCSAINAARHQCRAQHCRAQHCRAQHCRVQHCRVQTALSRARSTVARKQHWSLSRTLLMGYINMRLILKGRSKLRYIKSDAKA